MSQEKKASMISGGMRDEVAEAILIGCDYTSFANRMDPGYWRQDTDRRRQTCKLITLNILSL